MVTFGRSATVFCFLSAKTNYLYYFVVYFPAETANMFYDDNRREVLDVLTPFIEEFCESLFLGVANQILSTLPFEEMFIEEAPKEPSPPL